MSNSASENIDDEAHTAYPPNPELGVGAEFHSCEHCRDFTLDFGLTDGELDEMLQNGLSTATGLTTTIIGRVKKIRNKYGNLAIFSDTRDQVVQKGNIGCKLYDSLSLAIDQTDDVEGDILCAVFDSFVSILHIYEVGTSIKNRQTFQLYVPRDNSLAGRILNRPIVADPWSESTKAQVTQWMKNCSDPEKMGPNEEGFFLPTYLIELSPCTSKCHSDCPSDCCGFTLRLTKDIQGPVSYAALSYCWGGDQHFKTTKSNIHILLHNIRYADMPATLKDAAKVAFDLNFRFLWIDALCLIQDPGEDEMHTMIAEIPNIYRHATLTIAAKSSNSANEGFLRPRQMKHCTVLDEFLLCYGLNDFQITIKDLFGKSGFAMVRTYKIMEKGLIPMIEKRGWTLQEQVLSKRYLSFSSIATQWQFYGASSGEGYLADGGDAITWIDPLDSISSKWKSLKFLKPPKKTQKHQSLWQDLVAEYMVRHLSIRKDRPIAISALASDLGDANDYVAGVWLSDLCHGLSWVPTALQKEAVVDYFTPSWSWWSAEEYITWLVTEKSDMRQEPRFQLVDYYSKLAHPTAPFGYLVQASLRVEARCGQVLFNDHLAGDYNSSFGFEYGTSEYVRFSGGYTWEYDVVLDRRDENVEGQVLQFLILFVSEKETTRICGLVLIDATNGGSEQDRKCRRVGAFKFERQMKDEQRIFAEWLREQPVETLTLV